MKSITDFIKTTLAGGFFVILPMLIIYLLVKETMGAVIALSSPIADLLPAGLLEKTGAPGLVALILLILLAFIMGVILRYALAQKVIDAFENNVLSKLPGYTIIRSLTRRIGGIEEDDAFRPALMRMPMDSFAPVFIIEDLPDGFYSVLVPMTPTPGAGNVLIVPAERIQLLDASTASVFDALSRWGEGLKDALSDHSLR